MISLCCHSGSWKSPTLSFHDKIFIEDVSISFACGYINKRSAPVPKVTHCICHYIPPQRNTPSIIHTSRSKRALALYPLLFLYFLVNEFAVFSFLIAGNQGAEDYFSPWQQELPFSFQVWRFNNGRALFFCLFGNKYLKRSKNVYYLVSAYYDARNLIKFLHLYVLLSPL